MQKKIAILLPILALNSSLLFGCENNKEKNKTFLTYGDLNISEKNFSDFSKNYEYELSYSELKNKIQLNNENFMVAIANDNGCTCWTYLAAVINVYLQDTNTICYRVKISEFDEKDSFGLNVTDGTSSFAIFKDGQIKKQLNTTVNEKETHNYDSFKSFMDKNVILPKMYYINSEDYENVTTWNPNCRATVYLSRSGCSDCQAIEPRILKPYFENRKDSNNLYILDCQKYWKNSSDPNYQDYLDAKFNFGLTAESNPLYGYNSGVFPSFLYWNNVTCECGAVAYNDTITKQNDKYVITDTYYTTERKVNLPYLKDNQILKNKEIPQTELDIAGEYIRWNYDYSTNYYKEVIGQFLDYTLPFGNDRIKK